MTLRTYAVGILLAATAVTILSLAARARPVTPLDLLTLRDVGDAIGDGYSISPDGQHIAYQVRQADPNTNGYHCWWVLVDTATRGSRIVVKDGGEPTWDDSGQWTAYAPVWTSDSTAFYYLRRDRGATSLHRVSLKGADQQIRITGHGDIVSLAPWDRNHADLTIESTSPETITASKELSRNGLLLTFGYRADLRGPRTGRYDPLSGPLDVSPEKISHDYVLDFRTSALTPINVSPQLRYNEDSIQVVKNLRERFFFTASPDGSKIAFEAETAPPDAPSQLQYAVYVTPNKGAPVQRVTPLTDSAIEQIAWSNDSHQIYYVRQNHLTNFDIFVAYLPSMKTRQVTNSHAVFGDCSFAANASLAACTMESPQHPANIALVRLDTGAITLVSNLNSEFEHLDKPRMETLVWKNRDRDLLFAELIYPRNYEPGHRYPLIVTPYHAVGFQRGASGDEYPISVFAANGFFVLNLDVNNTTGYEPEGLNETQPLSLTVLAWKSPVDGIEEMVHKLSDRGLIDINRVGICGLSFGTEVTQYAISHSLLFKAAIVDGGSWDPIDYYFKTELMQMIYSALELNGPPYEANLAKWKLISPALRAAHITAPLLMNAPDSEYLSVLQQYWEMRDHDRPVELWIFPRETHVKHEPVHRLVIYERNLDWFKYWLTGLRDTDPAKREQYLRWDALRAQRDALLRRGAQIQP